MIVVVILFALFLVVLTVADLLPALAQPHGPRRPRGGRWVPHRSSHVGGSLCHTGDRPRRRRRHARPHGPHPRRTRRRPSPSWSAELERRFLSW